MGYTLAQIRSFSSAIARIERERIIGHALAARAGMADEKGWTRWLDTFNRD
jgi:hypothetical protein